MQGCNILVVNCGGHELTEAFLHNLGGQTSQGYRVARLDLPSTAGQWAEALAEGIDLYRTGITVLCTPWERTQDVVQMLSRLQEWGKETGFTVAIEAKGDDNTVIERLFGLGIVDYFAAPFRAVDLLPRLERLRRERPVTDPLVARLKAKLGLQRFVGEDPRFVETIRRIPATAASDATALILGESGTGKEICAQAIHHLSPRSGGPFVPVNCGAVPVELVENELFGHARGAFTGADSATEGLVNQAEGGTLFLDEVDCLPLGAQVKLLRFLQEGEYRQLGSQRSRTSNIRVVAASNQNLEQARQSGTLRADLYYRLSVIVLEMPPLRERRSDIALLARHFATFFAEERGLPEKPLTRSALNKLLLHDWPGNVRELENVIQRALVFSESEQLHADDIQLPLSVSVDADESFKTLKAKAVAEFERAYLLQQLDSHGGNITQAARASHKNRRAFWELMRKHQLNLDAPTSPTALGHQRM